MAWIIKCQNSLLLSFSGLDCVSWMFSLKEIHQRYSWFHENGSFSAYSFDQHYLSFPEYGRIQAGGGAMGGAKSYEKGRERGGGNFWILPPELLHEYASVAEGTVFRKHTVYKSPPALSVY